VLFRSAAPAGGEATGGPRPAIAGAEPAFAGATGAAAPARPQILRAAAPNAGPDETASPAPPAMPAAAPATTTGANRPLARLRLADTPQAGAPPQPRAAARTTRIARAAAAAPAPDALDLATVSFPPPPDERPGGAAVLARSPAPNGSAARASTAAFPEAPALAALTQSRHGAIAREVTDAATPATASAAAAPEPNPLDARRARDEMYQDLLERLRRDLLMERERMGDLVGDLL